MLCPVRICKHVKEAEVPVQDAWADRVDSHPLPRSAAGAVGVGGGGLAGCVLPGILSREGGIFGL